MEVDIDKVAENNFLDLLKISAEFGEEDENQLFQWVRPVMPPTRHSVSSEGVIIFFF